MATPLRNKFAPRAETELLIPCPRDPEVLTSNWAAAAAHWASEQPLALVQVPVDLTG